MSGQPDAADWLYDRRMIPPEPEDYTWQPEPDADFKYRTTDLREKETNV